MCRIVCVRLVLLYDIIILPLGHLNLSEARISFLSPDLFNDAISAKHRCGDEMGEYEMDWTCSTRISNTDKISVSKYADVLVVLKRFQNKYGLRASADWGQDVNDDSWEDFVETGIS